MEKAHALASAPTLRLTPDVRIHSESVLSELEQSFRSAFNLFRTAIHRKDCGLVRVAMAECSYIRAKNEATRVRLGFPEDLFCGIVGKMTAGVDLTRSTTLRVEENGRTGMLLAYFSTRDHFDPFGLGTGMPAVIVLRYIREGGIWKYDSLLMNPLDPDQVADLNNGNYSQLDCPRFHPNGQVPPTPVEQGPPCYDYEALINVNSFGYHAEIILNGISIVRTTANTAARAGLRKGENTITIKSAVLEHPDIIRITIQARNREEYKPVEVFKVQLDHPEPTITQEFVVTLD
jgi:hypothetical protein